MSADPDHPMQHVHTAYGLPEAEMIRSMLEAAGVEVLLTPSGAGVAYGFTVGPMARVEVFVRPGDVELAREIIAQLDDSSADTTENPTPPTPAD